MKTKIFLAIICIFIAACTAAKPKPDVASPPKSEDKTERSDYLDPFDRLALETLTYFTPLSGVVNSVQEGVVSASIAGAKKGMRLKVFRQAEPYYHPITGAEIARTESKVGTVEIIDVSEGGLKAVVIEGEAAKGDLLRLSSAKIKVLFYQSADVPWAIAEEYFDTLSRTERFELIGASSLTLKEDALWAEAKKVSAELVLMLSAKETEQGTVLNPKLIWTADTKTLASSEALIERGYARELKVGEEFFFPAQAPSVRVFDLPFSSSLIASADINADGTEEIALSTGKDIVFYNAGVTLKPALEGQKITLSGEHIWLDASGPNVLVVTLEKAAVRSYLYEFSGGRFNLKNKWDFFARMLNGEIYGQEGLSTGGFKGAVFKLDASGQRKTAEFPKNLNLYDFIPLGDLIVAYDEVGYINIYGPSGTLLWRSKESFGGPLRVFSKEPPTEMAPKEEWSIKDRLIRSAWGITAIKRIRVAETAPGFGFKNSEIRALIWDGNSINNKPLVEVVPGKATDFALLGNNLAVLSEQIKLSNIIKGLGIMGTKLYIYSLSEGSKNAGQ